MNLQAILFDVDGVLFNTEHLHRKAWLRVLPDFGIETEEYTLYRWTGINCREMGKYYADILLENEVPLEGERITKSYLGEFPRDRLAEKIHHAKEKVMKQITRKEISLDPKLREYLEYFSNSISLAYVTTTRREILDIFLKKTGAEFFFTTGVAFEDAEKTKPFPDPYIEALDRLGISAGGAVALEDSPAGIQSAADAGIFCIGIANTMDPEKLSRANIIFPSVLEACRWVRDTKPFTAYDS